MGVWPRALVARHAPGAFVASEYADIGCLSASHTPLSTRPGGVAVCKPYTLDWRGAATITTNCGELLSQRAGPGATPMHGSKVQRHVALGISRRDINLRPRQQQVHAALVPKSCRPVQQRAACARAPRSVPRRSPQVVVWLNRKMPVM